jgi:hypothetical protein
MTARPRSLGAIRAATERALRRSRRASPARARFGGRGGRGGKGGREQGPGAGALARRNEMDVLDVRVSRDHSINAAAG